MKIQRNKQRNDFLSISLVLGLAVLMLPSILVAQSSSTSWGSGRLSLFAQGSSLTNPDGTSTTYNELVSYFSLQSPGNMESGTEFGVDLRASGNPGMEERPTRFSLYTAFVGRRAPNYGFRAGQLWVNELGALGSVGGGMGYFKSGHVRFGGFGGYEPEILNAGYVPNVLKFGGFVAYNGDHALSSSVGYVNVRHSGITERSVLVFTNYLPAGNSVFIYQSAEVDLTGPGGVGSGGLTYFFINGRANVTPRLELQGTYHHGRSIDARSITLDQLNGRPVDPAALNGFLYESADARATVRIVSNFSVFAGYGQDRSGPTQANLSRLQYGFFTSDLMNSGVDLHFSGYRFTPPDGPAYGSWSISAGRMVGSKVYLSGEYSSSLAVLTSTEQNGIIVVNQPHSSRYSFSSMVNLTRALSLTFTADKITGDLEDELRFLAGITFRFY